MEDPYLEPLPHLTLRRNAQFGGAVQLTLNISDGEQLVREVLDEVGRDKLHARRWQTAGAVDVFLWVGDALGQEAVAETAQWVAMLLIAKVQARRPRFREEPLREQPGDVIVDAGPDLDVERVAQRVAQLLREGPPGPPQGETVKDL